MKIPTRIIYRLVAAVILTTACATATAEHELAPLEGYTVGPQQHPIVLYYTTTAHGYKVVTTWLANDGRGPAMQHIALLAPGERYTLSLAEAGLPMTLTIRSDDAHVTMAATEPPDAMIAALDPGATCPTLEPFGPTPVQRLLLCQAPPKERLACSSDPC